MNFLIVGGAGYIGSHMVCMLLDAGHDVVTLDSLVTGHSDAILGGDFVYGDISDRLLLDRIFSLNKFDAVFNFAGHSQVGESLGDPARYYRNNFSNTQNLLDAMLEHGVSNLIYSSSAAIFGNPKSISIDEGHPKCPINPYGKTKLMVEQMLADYDYAYGLKFISLRYFNAAGAHTNGLLGERHNPETHLIPIVLQVGSGRREAVSVFGRDYPTFDGTCVRDYVHVLDLCKAHLLALDQLMAKGESCAYNLGNSVGFSVQQIIDVASKVTGRKINVIDSPRRSGDPAVLVANANLARSDLGWIPEYESIETIIKTAWDWELNYLSNL